MRKLTENQKEFLIGAFFTPNYAGWRNIATMLVLTGKCTVAGESCIWSGGIGNFIETKEAEDLIGCLEYTFDLEEFIGSGIFLNGQEVFLSQCEDTKREAEDMLRNAVEEINDINNLK